MCLYCNSIENKHFVCESCGAGMCEECYNLGVEHDIHYWEILENCDNDEEVRAVLKFCNGIEPAYFCQNCLDKAMSGKPRPQNISVKIENFFPERQVISSKGQFGRKVKKPTKENNDNRCR